MTADLAGFLLARIAEDEAWIASNSNYLDECQECAFGQQPSSPYSRARVLAECEAKRRIVETAGSSQCGGYGESDHPHYPDHGWGFCDGCSAAASADSERSWVLRLLALPYADHDAYREEWRA